MNRATEKIRIVWNSCGHPVFLSVTLFLLALSPLHVGAASAASSIQAVAETGNDGGHQPAVFGDSSMSYSGANGPALFTYLPAVLNNAYGGWTTGINIVNTAASGTDLTIKYYNSTGTPVKSQGYTIPAHGSIGVSQASAGLSNGFAGSAVVAANQAVSVMVNETSSTGAMAYEGGLTPSKRIDLPVIMNNAYGGWTTGINIINTSLTPNTVTIAYFASGGWLVGVQTNTLSPNAYWGVSNASSGLPNGFIGTAEINGTQTVEAVVNETNGVTGGSMSYRGFTFVNLTSQALPVILNNAYGGWTTGVNLMNTGNANALVTINYYNTNGVLAGSQSQTIAGKAYWGISQASAGLPSGFIGSAVVTSSLGIVAVVNETKTDGNSMAYQGANPYWVTTYLPVVMNNAYGGWTTGINIQNPGNVVAITTVSYYNSSGGFITSQPMIIPAKGYMGVSQGSGSLANGQAGSAVVTSTQPVAIVVNETK